MRQKQSKKSCKGNTDVFCYIVLLILLIFNILTFLRIGSIQKELDLTKNNITEHVSMGHLDVKSLEEVLGSLYGKISHIESVFWKQAEGLNDVVDLINISNEINPVKDHGHIGIYGGVRHESNP